MEVMGYSEGSADSISMGKVRHIFDEARPPRFGFT